MTGPAAPAAVDLTGLVAAVRRRLAETGAPVDPAAVDRALRDCGRVLGSAALAELGPVVRAEILGAGALQPLLDDPDVTDVLVNGPEEVWVERRGQLVRVPLSLGDPGRVRELAVRLAAAGGQRLDDARPAVDARLPDGTRLHAVLPPVADGCTLLSLRTVRPRAFTLPELVASGTVAAPVGELLHRLVRVRANLLVSGATGTGKTTLLSTLLSLADHGERIVCVEEAGELAPRHPHVVRLLARRPNVEHAGGVDLADLVRESLRMRPDRVVLGECRGVEIREVLSALNTGHDGGCTTVHANTAADVPARLEALGASAGLGRAALAAQAVSAFHAVVHLRRDAGRRRVAEIGVVEREGAEGLVVRTAVLVDPDGAVSAGPGWEALAARVAARSSAPGAGRAPVPSPPVPSAPVPAVPVPALVPSPPAPAPSPAHLGPEGTLRARRRPS
ncbi:TadA family conjugal transfer-associated ATPase [Cellulomonas sp. ES6]|uniref:TadA family conjugal transfer-associated ATPase n=1 Tax=Cellulomonas sp. ES6 TaxID=3039384 RepID=UPI0024B7FE7A|nr:TadA family conjugal transfer-associated ATPase [Cellulomonas sp. ES6]WHP19245.1 TadA family conjugal transfer-associated ATPase [Cellulomonas sp. ES6]